MMKDAIVGLDHVQVAVPPGNESIVEAFYGGKLGMTVIPKPAPLVPKGGVWFQCGLHQLHVGVQKDFVPAAKAHPAFMVRTLSEYRKALLAAGVEVEDDYSLPDVERLFVHDPFGNRIEFLQRL